MKYLELVRWKNLLIILFIGLIIRYFIILPIIASSSPLMIMDSNFPNLNFILLLISCLSIAASGNIINDYYDIKTDNINKPEKVLIPKKISQGKVMKLHHFFNFIGLSTGLYLAYTLDNFSFAFPFVITVILLRLYSMNYSRMLIIGNLVVSFLAGLLILVLGTFETFAFHEKWFPVLQMTDNITFETSPAKYISDWLFGLAFFSFMVTWIRELAKDVADVEGDRFVGGQTIPIKWGVKVSKGFIISVSTVCILATVYLINLMDDPKRFQYSFEYGSVIIALLIGIIYLTLKADSKESYLLISTVTKTLMIIGIIYPIVNHIFLNI